MPISNKNPHGQSIGDLPLFLTSRGVQDRGIFVARRGWKSNNFLGKIAAAVYQHVAHLSNAGWNGDTQVPSGNKTRRRINQPPTGWFMPSLWQWDTS